MKNKFFKLTFKSLLLPAAVICGIMLLVAFLTSINANITNTYREIGEIPSVYYLYERANSSISTIVIFSAIGACFLPFAVFSYRYSLQKADIYNQAPFEEKTVRNTRVLVGLIYICIIFTASFFILFTGYGIRVMLTRLPLVEPGTSSYRTLATINPEIWFLGYILGLLIVTSTYVVVCYFVSKSTSLPNAILTSMSGMLILGGTIFALTYAPCFLYTYNLSDYSLWFVYLYRIGFTPFQASSFIISSLDIQAVSATPEFTHTTLDYVNLINMIISILLGGLSSIPLLFAKEPSGETSGKGFGKRKGERIIHHILFGVLGYGISYFASTTTFIVSFIFFSFMATAYVLITAWLNRSFKFKKCDLLPMIITISASFVTMIVFFIVGAVVKGDLVIVA